MNPQLCRRPLRGAVWVSRARNAGVSVLRVLGRLGTAAAGSGAAGAGRAAEAEAAAPAEPQPTAVSAAASANSDAARLIPQSAAAPARAPRCAAPPSAG